jgi:hypothetical protein
MKHSETVEDTNPWFIFPLEFPCDVEEEDDVHVSDIQVRVNLLFLIYRWSIIERISDMTIDSKLSDFHTKFMNLSTKEGRECDYNSYWGTVFMCAMNADLMERWAFAENYLFNFRLRTYFSEIKSFKRLVRHNIAHIKGVDISLSKGEPVFRVPWEKAHNLLCNGISLDGGFVVLRADQFHYWVWNSMRATYASTLRRLHPKVSDIQRVEEGDEFFLMQECNKVIDESLGVEAEIQKVRKKRHREKFGGPPGCITDIEDLTPAAKSMYPPCQARHVYEAVVNGKHLKYEARKAYIMFTLEAGHDVEEVESSLYELWNCDQSAKNDKKMFPRGFNKEEFLKSFKDVDGINKAMTRTTSPITAYGCWSLEKKSKNSGTSCAGCPFSRSYDERPLLDWMGYTPEEVKDIMSRGSVTDKMPNQVKCSRAFALKTKSTKDIKHPNMFYREAGRAQKTNKRAAVF